MKIKFNFLLMPLLTAFAVSVTSCDDDLDPNTFEGAAAKYVGHTYQLTDVHWSGTSVDLDGDGIRRWDLLEEEMKHLKGFDLDRHIGVVQKHRSRFNSENKPTMDFLAGLPLPIYTQIDGKWEVDHIMYISVFPEMVFQGDGCWSSVKYYIHNFRDFPFIGEIDDLVVTNLKPDSFDISVVCSLINEKNELEENVLIYHYQR